MYSDHQLFAFQPSHEGQIDVPLFNLYYHQESYDSVIQIIDSLPINDPLPSPNCLQFLRVATWNLRGCSSAEEREMVEFCLLMNSLDLIAVQETHSNAANLKTANYTWYLGPQYQARSSRGIGFLVSRRALTYVLSVTFVTANIGYVTLRIPFLSKDLHVITVHKLNNRDPSSIIETGKALISAFKFNLIIPPLRPLIFINSRVEYSR